MSRIENHKYTIEEAFRECFYVVPDYQREYVWTEKEVQQLLDDIAEQIGSGRNTEYFVGMVLVAPAEQKGHVEVIDGQQRLTTFFLLLCALRNLFAGQAQYQTLNGLISTSYTTPMGETQTSLRLEPRYENAGDLIAKIVETNGDPDATRRAATASGMRSFGSLDNLLNAYALLHTHLKDGYDAAGLRKYWGYLANKVVFIQISTDVSSALKIFETINDRGIGLNPMDLLKNLLFTHVQTDDFTRLKTEWKKITAPLEKAKEKPLRFLRYFLMANYPVKNDRSDNVIREEEIYDWLTTPENARMCGYANDPFGFVRRIVRGVEHYIAFTKGSANDDQPSVAMQNLKQMTGGAFSLHFVLLLAASELPRPLFDHFVRQIESFLFFYIYTKTPTKELERNFSLWADELREIAAEKDAIRQADRLNKFVAERFQKSMRAKEGELTDALKRYSLYSMQRYRTQYLLGKLTQYVDAAYKGALAEGPVAEYKPLEIEHILPNNPEKSLRDAFGAENPGRSYDDVKNRLGNLTLLEKPINVVASNNFFALKLPEYKKSKNYLTSSIAELVPVGKNSSTNRMNVKLRSFARWSAGTIDERQALLADLAKEIWRTGEFKTS